MNDLTRSETRLLYDNLRLAASHVYIVTSPSLLLRNFDSNLYPAIALLPTPAISMQMSVMNRVTVPVVTGLRLANTACSRRVVRLQAKSEEPAESSSGQDSYSVCPLGRLTACGCASVSRSFRLFFSYLADLATL